MAYSIRHAATGDIVKMRSGKSAWAKAAHAKAAWVASGLDLQDRKKYDYTPTGSRWGYGRDNWKFDSQDLFEIVEAADTSVQAVKLNQALDLLESALCQLDDGAHLLYDEIAEFLKGANR